MSVHFSSSFQWLSNSRLFKASPTQPLQHQGVPSPGSDGEDEYDLVELPKLGPQGKSNLALAGLLATMAGLMTVFQPTPKPPAPVQVTPPTIQTQTQSKSPQIEAKPMGSSIEPAPVQDQKPE